ncbi:MAG: sulfatase-like hydrolase/transferase [bacterium]|nr:sulfatase-like hydrolase/transferase [bacterium]
MRQWTRSSIVAMALIGALVGQTSTRPDIVLIMADDVGVEAFSSYGGESYDTPHLDALAQAGMQFQHCHSQPLCTPSRVKLMTGQSNIRNYRSFGILPRGSVTFANVLQDAGYRTCVVGKWQLFGSRQELLPKGAGTSPAAAGFDEHLLWQVDRIGSRYGKALLVENGRYADRASAGYGPDRFADFAIDFIARQRKAEQPYLLYFPMALVHSPFESPPNADPVDAPPKSRDGKQARFAQMMTHMDAIVGRLLGAVDENDGRERTLFLFTSDNGTPRNIVSRQNGRPVRGGKGLSNDRGTHVPLVARWPGTIPADRTNDSLIDFTDFFVTLLATAGAEQPASLTLDGRSFLPQLRGEPGTPRDSLFCYYNPRPERRKFARGRFARDQHFKLYGDGRFFDLVNDPEEQTPLPTDDLATNPQRRAAHRKLMAAIAAMPEHPLAIAPEHR